MEIDRKSNDITSKTFNIYNILPGKFCKLDLSRAVYLEPARKIYPPVERGLGGCCDKVKETQNYQRHLS